MANLLCDLLVKILMTWLLTWPVGFAIPINHGDDPVFVQPSDLVVKDPSDRPLKYHFIIDYPHPPVPGNQYYKPWNTVSSNHITVRNTENDLSRILRKKNILYLSKAEEDQIPSSKIKE